MQKSSCYNVFEWEHNRRQQVQNIKRICKYEPNSFTLQGKNKKRKSQSRGHFEKNMYGWNFETYYSEVKNGRAFRPAIRHELHMMGAHNSHDMEGIFPDLGRKNTIEGHTL